METTIAPPERIGQPEQVQTDRLAELAGKVGSFTDGRLLLDALCHATDGIPDLDVIESPDYRAVARRIADLLFGAVPDLSTGRSRA